MLFFFSFFFSSVSLQYLGHVEVEESRGMHICEDAVKRLKTVGVYYTELCFPRPVFQKPGRVHFSHPVPLYPATLFFSGLSVFLLPPPPRLFLSSHQASQSHSADPNLCSVLEHKVTLCSTFPPAPPYTPSWAIYFAPRYPSVSSPSSYPPIA